MKNCICLAFTQVRAVSVVQDDAEASTYCIPPISYFFIPTSGAVQARGREEARTNPVFFTALQGGNIELQLYYLWKMVACGARDNCCSKRFVHRELSGAEAGS